MVEPLDELNDALDDVEDALVSRGFGVPAEVDLDGEHRLGFVKHGAEWILVVRNANLTDAAPRVDLLRSSARIRLAAAHALPLLYEELARAKTDRDLVTRLATAEARKLAARIRTDALTAPSSSHGEGSK